MNKELWKSVKGFTDYKVSNQGKVKSFKLNTEKILKQCNDKKEYLLVKLSKSRNSKTKTVHRLVATAFIPNPDNKPQVNHKDGNKQNNCVDNLEWVTQSENDIHAFKIGLKTQQGIENANSKLSENDVLGIRGLYLDGLTQKEIAKIYLINQSNVSIIINKKRWKHLI